MEIKIETSATIKISAHFNDGVLKTYAHPIGTWRGDNYSEEIDIAEELREANLPCGEYEITIILKKI
jgi:hypothetical protein